MPRYSRSVTDVTDVTDTLGRLKGASNSRTVRLLPCSVIAEYVPCTIRHIRHRLRRRARWPLRLRSRSRLRSSLTLNGCYAHLRALAALPSVMRRRGPHQLSGRRWGGKGWGSLADNPDPP